MSLLDRMEAVKSSACYTLDFTAIAVGISAFVGWLPDVAAFLTVVYIGVRIYNEVMKARDFSRRRKIEFGEEGD